MYLFFDTETTGLPRNWNAPVTDLGNWPRLVELAWLLYDEQGRCAESQSVIVRPDGFSVPADAAAVHGITTARAMTEGVALKTALGKFVRSVEASRLLIAHNISFDEKIVGAEILRAGVDRRFFEVERCCTMKESTAFCAIPNRYGFKWPTLAELHDRLFGKKLDDTHRAGVDVQACAKCFFEMKQRGIIKLSAT